MSLLGSKFIDEVIGKLKPNGEKVFIDNQGFRIFSKFTVSALVVCCGLVTLQQLLGKHIECITPQKEDVRIAALNQYCFIMSTYTLPHLYNETVGEKSAHFGVGTYDKHSDQEQKYHAYYQWVPFVLFFQAILFYVPHMIWKSFEEGKITSFCNLEIADKIKLKHRKFIDEFGSKVDEIKKKKETVINRAAVTYGAYLNYNQVYAYTYIICEILNFVIVILNIFMTDAFLGYEFSTYGPDVVGFLKEDPENRIDPMNKIFPKVTKCDFHKYGTGGNLVNYDVMCVLALNIINEKIYTFLWFWFVMLAIIGGLIIIYRLTVVFSPPIRNYLFHRKLLKTDHDEYYMFQDRLTYADWFVLKRLADNLNGMRLGDFCKSLNKHLHQTPVLPMAPMTPPPDYDKNKQFEIDDEVKKPFIE